MGPMYQFHKNDVVQNMILTENLLGTVEYIHTGSDELTDIIDIEESSDEEPPPWNDETGLQLADLPKIPRITIPVNLPIEHCKPSLYARQISPQEPPPGYNEIRLQPEDPPKIQRNIIPVDQSIQQCQPSLYARQISPQGPSPVHSGKSLQFQSPRGLTYIRNPDFPPIPQGQPLPPPRYKAPQRQGLRIPDRQQESSSIQTSSQEPSMKINNEQEPITGVVFVADIGNCPPGYTAIERDIGDFWMGKHYMCIGRDASSQCRTVLVDVCFINKQVPPPPGFTLIGTTYDTREEWTQKRIYVSWMNTSLTTSAITDITFVKKKS
ncbi:uncharacterized protein LOC128246417 [Mya arenaria]|uniref:uncharacterized protein LOC128246417 n=1 Tax=Mya arenaria TaxID=6604 RepID=UPI0022DF72A8|nr:uncharacterized protein LOC128246417 [Mya arenaria]